MKKYETREIKPLGGKRRLEFKIKKEAYRCGAYCPTTTKSGPGGDYLADFKNKILYQGLLDDDNNMIKLYKKYIF